jgi:hypothetical protein
MDSRNIKVIINLSLAAFAALYLGISAATAQLETIAWVVGTATFVTCLLLGRRIWLLIPFLGALAFTFRVPSLPTSLLIAQFLFIGFSALLILMRKLPFRIHFTELEFWTILIIAFVLQVYIRNPTGISLFGGATVGGKAYIIFAITVATSVLLYGLRVPFQELKLILRLSIWGGVLNFIFFLIGFFFPGIGMWYGAASGFDTGTANNGGYSSSRVGFLGTASKNLSLWVCAFISPLRSLGRPFWLFLIIISLGFAAASGYRNNVAAVGLTFIFGLIYRGGLTHIFAAIMLSILGVISLNMVNLVTPLPLTMQRSLSFIPGTWDKDVVNDTESSTEWRIEIWKEVLFTDRWINNKLLGDGLGFTTIELQTQMNLSELKGVTGTSGFDMHRETILSNADYHSGPVQTIRTIGYIGLIALLLAMIRLAIHAHCQIQRCRDTEWFPLALFVGIPLIWGPIFFVFIFGSFTTGTTTFLMGAAMIRMLENNLPLPAYVAKRYRVYHPLALRNTALNRRGALPN